MITNNICFFCFITLLQPVYLSRHATLFYQRIANPRYNDPARCITTPYVEAPLSLTHVSTYVNDFFPGVAHLPNDMGIFFSGQVAFYSPRYIIGDGVVQRIVVID